MLTLLLAHDVRQIFQFVLPMPQHVVELQVQSDQHVVSWWFFEHDLRNGRWFFFIRGSIFFITNITIVDTVSQKIINCYDINDKIENFDYKMLIEILRITLKINIRKNFSYV